MVKKKEEELNLKEKISQGSLLCNLIFEVVGKPADFIEETTNKLMEELEKEKNVTLIKKNLGKAQPYQDTDLFCTFAETEILVENIKRVIDIVFDYMPSSIEICEPNELKLKVPDANLILNELASKLHEYDLSNKKLVFEKNVLFQKLQEMQEKDK